MTGVLIGTEEQTSYGTPMIADHTHEAKRESRACPPQSLQRDHSPVDFGLGASRTGRDYISAVLSHPVFGNLLRQP